MNKFMLKGKELNEEKLNELKEQTKDKFTRLLIEDLRRILTLQKKVENDKIPVYRGLAYERIINLIEKEKSRNKLRQDKNPKLLNSNFNLKVSRRGKSRIFNMPGSLTLEKLSTLIQKEFDLEPMHLYEFEIGKLRFGPECDEWQEIFDCLDNYRIGASIGSAELSKGDFFKFLYDFGENIKFKIEILDIKNGK